MQKHLEMPQGLRQSQGVITQEHITYTDPKTHIDTHGYIMTCTQTYTWIYRNKNIKIYTKQTHGDKDS